MGYIKIETFDDQAEWTRESVTDLYDIINSDWPEHLSSPDKTYAMSLSIDPTATPVETWFRKTYASPFYFKSDDGWGKPVYYPELTISLKSNYGHPHYKNPDLFFMSISLWDGVVKLREWFLPVCKATNDFAVHCFDLQPLIDAGYTKFDSIRFGVIQNVPNVFVNVIFGDAYLFQDEIEHNLMVSIADWMHNKMRTFITTLSQPCEPGDKTIRIASLVDLRENTAIVIGDPDGNHELHVISTAPYQHQGEAEVTFTGEFDTAQIQQSWPVDTPVWRVIPATFGDLSESEQVFPVFHITWDAPDPMEDMPGFGGWVRDSYIRDAGGNHTFSVRHPYETFKITVRIHVFSSDLETAVEMWKFLRSKIDRQSFIPVAGWRIDYSTVSHQRMNNEDDIASQSPHYVIEIDTYPIENLHKRKSVRFPVVSSVTYEIDAIPFTENLPL